MPNARLANRNGWHRSPALIALQVHRPVSSADEGLADRSLPENRYNVPGIFYPSHQQDTHMKPSDMQL